MSSKISKFSQVIIFSKKYPVSRGMLSYAIIWPVGSLIQQTFFCEEDYDFVKVARFSLYGSCYVAPTLHCWLKIASTIWPQNTLRSALTKAIVEQFTYTPFAMLSFYFGMTLLEGKTIEEGKNEVKAKFLQTYQIGVCVWPILQTFNYTVVKERNRVVFVSFCSLLWTSFLAYMKHLQGHEVPLGIKIREDQEEATSANNNKHKEDVHQIINGTSHDKPYVVKNHRLNQ